jgi:hypothetical protein
MNLPCPSRLKNADTDNGLRGRIRIAHQNRRDDAKLTVSFTPEAVALKDTALELSGVIGKVTNADENAAAVAAQVEIQKVRSLAEKARKAAKEPVLEYGKRIDAAAV